MSKVVLCEPLRTAIGSFGGTLQDIPAPDLGAIVVKEILKRTKIDPKQVDDCVMGNVLQAGQGMGPARQVALKAGLDVSVPAVTINRLCASGCQSIVFAAQQIKSGDVELVIAGGIENMNQAPFFLKKARYGYRMGMPKDDLYDSMVSDGLWDVFNNYHMGVTAENIAEKYKISREEQDEFAFKSQVKTKEAMESDRFQSEIVPIEVQQRKGTVVFKKDEHPRDDTTLESLSKLRPVFKNGGTVTAGNASGINDGAAAMIVTTEEKAKELGLKVWGTIKSYAVSGVDPSIMGMGPVTAMQKALEKAGLTIDDIDLAELNEAFAAQSLGVLREFPIPSDKLNINGGAIALGHPIGASGAILTVKILHELERRNASLGLVSLCVGGGMGIAMVVEREKEQRVKT
ncbi:MAG: thiolase family protein [Thermodesulfobacteriota bacterium]